jgi:ribA/ribD-fused uncharacterized protein
MSIKFYSASGEYGCFSNFSRHEVYIKGKNWKTSEHYFQAQKFTGTKYETQVAKANNAAEAAAIGRDRSLPLRKDWESVKDNIMREVVLMKFYQNDSCRKELLSTGDEELIEHTENDKYWADGGNGKGKNMLGKILMEVRAVLRDHDKWAESHPQHLLPTSGGPIIDYKNKYKLEF